eukprot:CAMPEP_0114340798 /NCGR_PEP_ID=MMETSP0101-20121206/8613_1 /TAXON_ID=38822 ORGANISM="Pteridomonas danica, Strain PT" /NCGR_SAMPLE_ID=MMETSP0101 /ASSEMBLY_ACC=CAM_ASM_000211 /LENGTH=170 /DNA_ID=CAMNT_0001474173 /DNA_START=54 /DNA_END=566 /DNA_ORIENTATION=-
MADKDVMKQTLEAVTSKIDKAIDEYAPAPVKEQLKSLEAVHPFLKQAYVVGGAIMIPVLLIFYFLGGLKLLVNLSSFSYPAYKSLQAISISDPAEDKQWLTYWIIYGSFSILESGLGFLVALIPYYNIIKLGIFIYLYHSTTKGATMVYDKVIAKYVVPLISGKKETKDE